MAITEISVSKIYVLATEPTNKVKDRFWFDTTNNLLKRYDGTTWKPISVSSDDVVVLSNGNKVSLTNYLNTQIAALAEGIDTKADKATTLAGYNIGDAYTKTEINSKLSDKQTILKGYSETYIEEYPGAGSINIDALANIRLAGNTITLDAEDGINGSVISTSIPEIASAVDTKLLSEKAVATALSKKADTTALANKQNNLYGYSEQYYSSGENDPRTVSEITLTVENNLNGTGNIILNADKNIELNGGVEGTAISTSIPTLASSVDTKLLSEKAIVSALNNKQTTLKNYNETTDSGSIRINNGINSISEIKVYNPETPNNPTITLYTDCDESTSNSKLTLSDKKVSITSLYNVVDVTSDNYQVATNIDTNKNGIQLQVNNDTAIHSAWVKVSESNVELHGYTAGGNSTLDIDDGEIIANSTRNIQLSSNDIKVNVVSSLSVETNRNMNGSSATFDISPDNNKWYFNSTASHYNHILMDESKLQLKYGIFDDVNRDNHININDSTIDINVNTGSTYGDINLNSYEVNVKANTIVLDANEISGTSILTTISDNPVDTKLVSEKAIKNELDKKQDKLLYYSEVSGETPSATISVANIKLAGSVAEGNGTIASGGYSHTQGKYNIEDTNNKYADIIGNGSSSARSNAATVSWDGISWNQTDVRAGGADQDTATHSLAAKQNSTDNTLETSAKTIVGAINEINSIFNVNALPTPITDVKTIVTTLENLITDTQYANKPGTILINPAITNTGVILVGEGITDINKAFPIYTDQPITIAFKNINDFKVAGNAAGDKFNYIISFGYINQNITSDSLTIATTNGVYTITPTGDAGFETLTTSKIS